MIILKHPFNIILLIVCILFFSSCKKEDAHNVSKGVIDNSYITQNSVNFSDRDIDFIISERTEPITKEVAYGVHEGHMPWRLDPAITAQYYIGYSILGKEIPDDIKNKMQNISSAKPNIINSEDKFHKIAQWKSHALKIDVYLTGYIGIDDEIIWQTTECIISKDK